MSRLFDDSNGDGLLVEGYSAIRPAGRQRPLEREWHVECLRVEGPAQLDLQSLIGGLRHPNAERTIFLDVSNDVAERGGPDFGMIAQIGCEFVQSFGRDGEAPFVVAYTMKRKCPPFVFAECGVHHLKQFAEVAAGGETEIGDTEDAERSVGTVPAHP